MRGRSNWCPNLLILGGVWTFISSYIAYISFNFMFRLSVPIMMRLAPLNKRLQLWLDVPLPLSIKASLTGAFASTEQLTNRTLARGQLDFEMEVEQTYANKKIAAPIMMMEEDGELDNMLQFLFVLASGPFNYWKCIAGGIAFLAFVVLIIAIILAVIKLIQQRKQRMEVGDSATTEKSGSRCASIIESEVNTENPIERSTQARIRKYSTIDGVEQKAESAFIRKLKDSDIIAQWKRSIAVASFGNK